MSPLPRIQNSSDLPDVLVLVTFAHSLQPGVEISSITLCQKRMGLHTGNWGKYYAGREKAITLCVPTITPPTVHRKHARYLLTCADRVEWLVATLAHELRHGWQHQVAGWSMTYNIRDLERDAEGYERLQLELWRRKALGITLPDLPFTQQRAATGA